MKPDLIAKLKENCWCDDTVDAELTANGWHGLFTPCACCQARYEIARLRAALSLCAANYVSEPCTIGQAAQLIFAEFKRRVQIAADALNQLERDPPESGTKEKDITTRSEAERPKSPHNPRQDREE